ncbi:MAG TPA: hypothetical protein VIA06_10460 [Candidatus Dormibacteraeota bacterium]|jgi:hypothetical protein|nr:hypothetical protein [Candidatus Dormibacteraeota bacterium]
MSGDTLLWVGLAVVIFVYVLARRLAGHPLSARRLFILPVVAVGLGLIELVNGAPAHVKPLDVELLLLSALISIGLGAWRGLTVRIFVRGGFPWQRYTAATVLLWIVQIAAKFAVTYGGEKGGATLASSTWALILTLGLSLAAEAAVIAPRALATHASFSPRGRSRLIDGLFGSPYPGSAPIPPDRAKTSVYPVAPPPATDPSYLSRRDARRQRRAQRRQGRYRY